MLKIDRFSQKPIYEQLIEKFEFLIFEEQLQKDQPMPSVRSLSQELSVNPNTIQKAYTELERRGLCYTVPGNGRFIAKNAKSMLMKNIHTHKSDFKEVIRKMINMGMTKEELVLLSKLTFDEYTKVRTQQ